MSSTPASPDVGPVTKLLDAIAEFEHATTANHEFGPIRRDAAQLTAALKRVPERLNTPQEPAPSRKATSYADVKSRIHADHADQHPNQGAGKNLPNLNNTSGGGAVPAGTSPQGAV